MALKRLVLLTLALFTLNLAHLFAQLDLTIDRVEVTQVIQDRDVAAGRDNIVRLVGFKETVARVYVACSTSWNAAPKRRS